MPGTIFEDPDAHPTSLSYAAYTAETYDARSNVTLSAVPTGGGTVWIDLVGLAGTDVLAAVSERFRLHPLVSEDISLPHQRPKVEEYDRQLFIVIRQLVPGVENTIHHEQISMVLGHDFLLTVQEEHGDHWALVRERLADGRGRIRGHGPDYLAYALLDAVVDGYTPLLDGYADELQEIEESRLGRSGPETLRQLQTLRHALQRVRRTLEPMRSVTASLVRLDTPLIDPQTRHFFRDCEDHVTRAREQLDHLVEYASTLMEAHLGFAGHQLNEVMRVLTVISTIFIPLSFIAGLYGMNFNPETSPYNMPELAWRYGYPAALALMGGVAVGLLWSFRRRGWLGRFSRKGDRRP